MESIGQFHPFRKLPAEIQLLVWSYYNDTQPILRHCFSLQSSRRTYVAIDEESRLSVDTAAVPGQETDLPPHQKIRLTGKVKIVSTIHPPYSAIRVQSMFRRGTTVPVCPAIVVVNYDRDVFHFDHSDYAFRRLRGRRRTQQHTRDWFRFLYNPITAGPTSLIDNQHWIFWVRKLALELPLRSRDLQQPDLDLLARMKRLKEVSLVVDSIPSAIDHNNPRPRFRRHAQVQATPHHIGFMTLAAFRAASAWHVHVNVPHADAVRDALVQLFNDHHMDVHVELVVDLY
ncbi:Uu.00g041220.m01.CDS01 [Anthostomella pinea]|uniref:Uu.00g041220.m01.CDS01 n=1 Tax=Anthostomella pinea TaxID=933095 RepID=A0AAI8YBL4_9PEZI|nr:Uu.00g041220.m01.CDS01 [Anthostomella pinea]